MRIRPALSPFLPSLAAALLLSASALAAQPAATAPAAKPPAAKPAAPPAPPAAATAPKPAPVTPIGVVPADAVNKMDQQTPAERDAMIKAMAEKLKKMTPAERKAFFEKNRADYAAMTPQQRKDMNDKVRRESAEYIAAHKDEWARAMADQKQLNDPKNKEFLEKIPGVERAVLQKYKDLRKTHGKDYAWHVIIEDAGHGGKITPLPE